MTVNVKDASIASQIHRAYTYAKQMMGTTAAIFVVFSGGSFAFCVFYG